MPVEVARILSERAFVHEGFRIGVQEALDDDLRARRDMQRYRFTGDEVDRTAEQGPHHVPLAHVLREWAACAERQRVVPPYTTATGIGSGLYCCKWPPQPCVGTMSLAILSRSTIIPR